MNKLAFGAAVALSLAMSATASAQQLAPAVVAVVDSQRILQQCTACVAANQQLQTQRQQYEQRAQALATPLQTEEQALQTALNQQLPSVNVNAPAQTQPAPAQPQQQRPTPRPQGR